MGSRKKSFPLRIDHGLYEVLEQWAADELRSVNSHIEFLLREDAKKSGRLKQVRKGTVKSPERNNWE